jgi:enoyl-[acyl-carrier protein] reductase I
MPLLEDKTGIIFGIANHRSLAWAIAQTADREGATLVLSYLNDRIERYVLDLAEKLSRPAMLVQCDVSDDAQIQRMYDEVRERYPRLDFLVHSIAFANRENLEGRFVDTSREDFHLALDASAYSLTAVSRGALPLLVDGGSIITLTYLGSVRAMQNYNVMGVAKAALEASVRYLAADLGPQGIRVNAISAGPVQTLSARGISGFTDFLKSMNERSALKRNIETTELGETAAFLLGPGSSGITGQVIYVDAGFNIMGV